MWEQLKKLTLSSGEDGTSAKEKQTSTPVREKATTTQAKPVKKPHKEGKQAQAQTSAAFSEILVYPEPIMKKSKQKKITVPPHLNSSQMIVSTCQRKNETNRKKKLKLNEKKQRERQRRQKKTGGGR